jgi:hypothetical protein
LRNKDVLRYSTGNCRCGIELAWKAGNGVPETNILPFYLYSLTKYNTFIAANYHRAISALRPVARRKTAGKGVCVSERALVRVSGIIFT